MRKKVLIIISIIWICFIFFNSFQTGTQSGAISGSFVTWIYNALLSINIEIDPSILSRVIRKGAHIFEFFILGILLTLLFLEYKLQDKYRIIYSISLALLIAIIDETIQTFIPGRSGNAIDVLIDTIGIVLGIGLVVLINLFNSRKKKKKKTKKKEDLE